jgi:hypothetical protein
MTLQASGPISFSQIANEFGTPPGKNLGAYRVSQTVGTLSNLPLDTGIPQSGTINFSDFYSKKLNVVVGFYDTSFIAQRLSARVRYNNQNVTVIGGFKTRPESGANTRIIINVNKIIGSNNASINNVALTTGEWEANTQLELEIGPSGQLYGSGGNGGRGADSSLTNSTVGGNGSSALGIQYPTTVTNRGYIQSGGGGGGGGSWTNQSRRTGSITRRRTEVRTAGAGGGGGSGYPGGAGGAGGGGASNNGSVGSSGGLITGGAGGTSGNAAGAGGSNGGNGASGTGKAGGTQGRAIIIYNNGTGTTITSIGGTVVGPIVYNTIPT